MNRRFVVAAALAGGFAMSPVMGSAAPTMSDALEAIGGYAPQALSEQGAPGMVVVITDRTRTVRIIPVGYANVETKLPVTESTRFPIGSITKSMTALALLQSVDAGRVDLQAPVTRYVPSFRLRSAANGILVHQLLSHTAGIPDDWSANFLSFGFALSALRDAPSIFAPGTSWSYSNDGYSTAGAVLESVTGGPWQDAIVSRVFGPIGMSSSDAYMTPQIFMQNVSEGYVNAAPELAQAPKFPLAPAPLYTMVDPAGSVIGSPEDMARYMRFYLNGGKTESGRQLIAPATFSAMTHADHLNNGRDAGAAKPELEEWPEFYTKYGYGLAVFDDGGDHLVGHTGGISGYTACMQINQTRGFGVIAMSNLIEAPLHPCAIVRYAMQVLRAQSAGAALTARPTPAPDPESNANAAAFAGTFRGSSSTFTIAATGTRATLTDNGRTYPVRFISPNALQVDDPALARFYLQPQRDKAGRVVALWDGGDEYTTSPQGPRTYPISTADQAFVGRYQMANEAFGNDTVVRVVPVKGVLTLDGGAPLKRTGPATFKGGGETVRFDSPFAGKMQRMWLDGFDFYRVNLP